MASVNQHSYKLMKGETVSRKDTMSKSVIRLSTFDCFPEDNDCSAIRLSEAGFFYIGDNDIECYSCSSKICILGKDFDSVQKKHLEGSPECSVMTTAMGFQGHIKGTRLDLVLKNQDVRSNFLDHLVSSSKTPPFGAEYRKSPGTDQKEPSAALGQSGSIPRKDAVRPKINYKNERERLDSFKKWPNDAPVHPEDLARSGFYYLGREDRVQCAFCFGILRNWEPTDQVDTEHRRHFGSCPFLDNPSGVGNILLEQKQAHGMENMTETPISPEFSEPVERFDSFKDFPAITSQRAGEFTRAGFYHNGIGDQVNCFFCDLGLRNWEPNDDPWTKHARWFPRCGYLRLCKGDKFIKEVQSRYALPSQDDEEPARKKPSDKKKKKNKKQSNDNNVVGHSEPVAHLDEEEVKQLEAGVQRLKEERLCQVCMDEEVPVVFLKCGHLDYCCKNCTPALGLCPICRNTIRDSMSW